MFIVLSHHHCKPDQVDLARQRIDQNAAAMTAEPGFLYRYRVERPSMPNILSALTAWNDEADYQRYRNKRFGAGHDLKSTPYEKVESETYQVHSTHGRVPI
jgi:hypothetical protein